MTPAARSVIRPIRVFVASPGDVQAERQAVREIADELNLPLRRRGWEVEVLGWEDRGPTGGRAQADINHDVRRCDVFIGILWQRWGMRTGTSTSGFAEEWALAKERFIRTHAPDLWLYFKSVDAKLRQGDESQISQVHAFRREIEESEVAFYKTFNEEAEFIKLVRERLLDEVFRRSGLTRTDIGVLVIDWATAYAEDPVWLVSGGRDRQTLATELLDSRPHDAADILIELADEVQAVGLANNADNLRIQACRALLAAEEPHDAVALLRTVLARDIWWMRFSEARRVLGELGDDWPPEIAGEVRGWRACCRSVGDPAGAAHIIAAALDEDHAIPLDETTAAHWRIVLWRCLLHQREPGRAASSAMDLQALDSEVQLELALLWADSLRAAGDPRADTTWQQLRLRAVEEATASPDKSAWISTRFALDLTSQQRLAEAETAYIDAATRWSAVEGGHEQAALAFFSAQAAAQLNRDWSFRGWAWREAAAIQRSATMSFSRRAGDLETLATNTSAHDDNEAVSLLTAALWLHQRAGLLHGVMWDLSLTADAYAASEDYVEAVKLYCHTHDCEGAKKAAANATDRTAVAASLRGSWPQWSAEARCAAVSSAGRAATPDVAADLLQVVLPALTPSGRAFDNTHRVAAEALAELTLAVEDNAAGPLAQLLLELASAQDYSLAQAGRYGLRMLCDVGRFGDLDALINRFALDGRPDEPDPSWVAKHLTTAPRVAFVRQAALAGHRRALLSLVLAKGIDGDDELREYCRRITTNMLNSDLGKTPDGKGIVGLMALDALGAIAAATDDKRLKAEAAETLLAYALENRWPMVNRVNAVAGVWPLIEPASSYEWLERLRPLAPFSALRSG